MEKEPLQLEKKSVLDSFIDEAKLSEKFLTVEQYKIDSDKYPQEPRKSIDVDLEMLVNPATDKYGNEGYYIVYYKQEKDGEYQKVIRKGADENDSQDWFKVALY